MQEWTSSDLRRRSGAAALALTTGGVRFWSSFHCAVVQPYRALHQPRCSFRARTTQVGSVVLRHKVADLGSLNADLGQTRDRRRPGMIADDSRRAEIARALQEGRKGEKNWDTSTVIRENSALRCFSAPEEKVRSMLLEWRHSKHL